MSKRFTIAIVSALAAPASRVRIMSKIRIACLHSQYWLIYIAERRFRPAGHGSPPGCSGRLALAPCIQLLPDRPRRGDELRIPARVVPLTFGAAAARPRRGRIAGPGGRGLPEPCEEK